MPSTRVRSYTARREGTTTRVDSYSRRTNGRKRPRWKLKPKRAARNFRRAYRAAKKNRGWTFLLWSAAGSSELLAFTLFRGGGGLLSVTGVGLGMLGTAMRNRT